MVACKADSRKVRSMPVSVSDLFRIPVIYGIDLEQNGNSVLYSSNPTGIPHLYILSTKADSELRQITSGNDAVMFGSLSPRGDQLAYLQDKDGNELHHLFIVSTEGGEAQRLTEKAYRTSGVDWRPDGKEVTRSLVTKKLCQLEAYDIETKESSVLREQAKPIFDIHYSHDGKWIACTESGGKDPKNQQILILNRDDPDEALVYNIKDGSKEALPSWSTNDERLAFLSDVKGRNQVVIQEFQGENRTFLSLSEGEEARGRIGWFPRGDKVVYIVSKHSRSAAYEHPLDGQKTAFPFPEGTILTSEISKDGEIIVAVCSSLSSPPGIYLHKTGSSSSTLLTRRDYEVDLGEISTPESVWYESFDGLKIHSWYIPAGYGSPPHPAVVWPHGGPWSQTFDSWSPYLQSISQSGFAVLAPNFRGSTGYGADFRNMDLSDPGGGDLEDVACGAEWLRKRSEIDGDKVAIMGGSYGGFMTLIALTRKPEVFSGGAALVPVVDWLEMYELSDSAFRSFMQELFEGTPAEKEDLYLERSPITHVYKIRAPILIVHGRQDSRCPIQPVEKFVKRLQEISHPHEFKVQEAEGHGFARVKANIQEVTTAIEYLKKALA
jgi:dipeptidyl aminopeptidase/acylaminoacyl peptidase